MADIQLKLGGTDQPFPTLLEFAETCRVFDTLPTVRKELQTAQKELARQPQYRQLLRDAEALDRAKLLAQSPRDHQRARVALERLAQQETDSPVRALAAACLAQLPADTDHTSSTPTQLTPPGDGLPEDRNQLAPLRTWTDDTGQFTIRARLVRVEDGKVHLQREDGRTITVPLDRLSKADRKRL